jgi:Fungal specific transcription factor domain
MIPQWTSRRRLADDSNCTFQRLTAGKILGYASSPLAADRSTFAIPGGDSNRVLDPASIYGRPLPISEILEVDLPSRELSDALIDTYFFTVHWFSLVVYEPKFRARYTTIMDGGLARPSDRPFLLLLLMVMVMGCWYGPGVLPPESASAVDLAHMRKTLLKVVLQNFMDLIDEDCLEFVQLSALLGSYWLYWGRPRSSFSILGAATKSAQAIGLHRDWDKHLSSPDAEERKRVWWTIYTWDRFDMAGLRKYCY